MYKQFTILSVCLVLSLLVQAQTDWKWPTDPEVKSIAMEKQAYYKVLMDMDDFDSSLKTLNWLYLNNPLLHPSIYQDGAKNIENLLETELSKKRRLSLEDSLLWMYDQRIEKFDEISAVDRKAYAAFKLFYKDSKRYPLLEVLYDTLFNLDASDISDFNLTPYMTLGVYYYKADSKEMTGEKVIEIYDKVTGVIDEKISRGGNEDKLKKEQNKVDALFNTIDLLNCQFIEDKIVPKMQAQPNDINIIKKVVTYSLRAKCLDQSYFLDAAELLYANDPSFKLAQVIADRYMISNTYSKAIEFYKYGQKLAETDQEKYELLLKEAQANSKLGKKAEARTKAIEALGYKSEDAKALELIGNLYMQSYNECKEDKSRVIDRAVFIAAYEMYKRAGNSDLMKQAKEQFPSIEEIFNEGFEEGGTIVVPCWIQMPVKLQRR